MKNLATYVLLASFSLACKQLPERVPSSSPLLDSKKEQDAVPTQTQPENPSSPKPTPGMDEIPGPKIPTPAPLGQGPQMAQVPAPDSMTPGPGPSATPAAPGSTPAPAPGAAPAPGPNPGPDTAVCNLPYKAGASTIKLMVGNTERVFRLFIPKKYDGKTYLPLVLNFHGSSNDYNDFAKGTGMETVAEQEGFIVAGISGVNKEWNVPPKANGPDEVQNAKQTIDYLIKTTCVNSKRVYATGFSGGGRTSSLIGCKIPEKLAAIAPVAGVRWPAPCTGRALPVLAIHGLKDATNSYAGDGNERWNESVEAAVQGWATHNSCNATRIVEPQVGTLSVYQYKQCTNGATVKLLRLTGEGHTYPTSNPINSAAVVWNFLKDYSL